MALVKCPVCNQEFDRETTDGAEKWKNRWYHPECFKEKMKERALLEQQALRPEEKPKPVDKKNIKKCFYCKGDVDITTEEYGKPRINRYAHKSCYMENYTLDEQCVDLLYQRLAEYGVKINFLKAENQRSTYISKDGFTNEGILRAIEYHYGVQKGNPAKAGGGIGIVPYVYSKAQEYYKLNATQKRKLVRVVHNQLKTKAESVTVTLTEKEKKNFIDLDSI